MSVWSGTGEDLRSATLVRMSDILEESGIDAGGQPSRLSGDAYPKNGSVDMEQRLGSARATPTGVSWVPDEVVADCRQIWNRLRGASSLQSLAVTSALRGEGRSTVATGLAVVQRTVMQRTTVLVELDLSKPSFADQLGIRRAPGLAEALRGEAPLVDCIQWVEAHLGVLAAGNVGEDGDAMLAGLGQSGLLSRLALLCEFTVADLPPLPPAGIADAVADLFGSVLLVVLAGATPLPTVSRAAATLQTPPAVVLNRTVSAIPRRLRRILAS